VKLYGSAEGGGKGNSWKEVGTEREDASSSKIGRVKRKEPIEKRHSEPKETRFLEDKKSL